MRTVMFIISLLVISIMCTSCGPAKVLPYEEIKANETAFVVPLEGATKKAQGSFMSLTYLKEHKVATKRVIIPVRSRSTGRMWYDYEWIPSVKVIKVKRSPVTREWTSDPSTGTSKANQAMTVESKDSISFHLGVVSTVMIAEPDTAQFLYTYAGKDLEKVMDQDVRGYVLGILAEEFGKRDLANCKKEKADIFKIAREKTAKHFKKFGVTVTNLGHSGGLTYVDKDIQQSINDAYIAEMRIQQTKQEQVAQENINAKELSIAVTARKKAEEFAKAEKAQKAMIELEIKRIRAQAMLEAAKKWGGKLPNSILPQGNGLLFGLGDMGK